MTMSELFDLSDIVGEIFSFLSLNQLVFEKKSVWNDSKWRWLVRYTFQLHSVNEPVSTEQFELLKKLMPQMKFKHVGLMDRSALSVVLKENRNIDAISINESKDLPQRVYHLVSILKQEKLEGNIKHLFMSYGVKRFLRLMVNSFKNVENLMVSLVTQKVIEEISFPKLKIVTLYSRNFETIDLTNIENVETINIEKCRSVTFNWTGVLNHVKLCPEVPPEPWIKTKVKHLTFTCTDLKFVWDFWASGIITAIGTKYPESLTINLDKIPDATAYIDVIRPLIDSLYFNEKIQCSRVRIHLVGNVDFSSLQSVSKLNVTYRYVQSLRKRMFIELPELDLLHQLYQKTSETKSRSKHLNDFQLRKRRRITIE